MSYHILNIDSVGSTLTCKDRQVVCIERDGTKRAVPLEDMGSIVVTSFKTTLTNRLLVEAAREGASIVVCDGFQPASILLPVNRSSDTALTRAHIDVHARQRSLLWRRTIDYAGAQAPHEFPGLVNGIKAKLLRIPRHGVNSFPVS